MSLSLVIAGVIGAGAVSALIYQTNAYQQQEKKLAFSSSISEARLSLTNKRVCARNFEGRSLSMTNAAGIPIDRLDWYEPNGSVGRRLLGLGIDSDGNQIDRLQLVPLGEIGTNTVLAELHISGRAAGMSTRENKIPLTFTIGAAGVISGCHAASADGSISNEEICRSAGMIYNSTTDRCAADPGTWFDGDASGAACPSGYRKNPDGWGMRCQWPPGWVDTRPQVVVTYADGTTTSGQTSPALDRLDPANPNAMTCTYASGYDSTGWVAGINCVRQ